MSERFAELAASMSRGARSKSALANVSTDPLTTAQARELMALVPQLEALRAQLRADAELTKTKP